MSQHYECNLCHRTFRQQVNLTYHIDNKVCVAQINEINNISNFVEKINQCICCFCNKQFTRKRNVIRHVDACPKYIEYLKNKIKEQENKIKEQEILIEELRKTSGSTINSHNNSNNSNNVVNSNNSINIKLVNYCREDYNKLSYEQKRRILRSGFRSVQLLLKEIHYNPAFPENLNVLIKNLQRNIGECFIDKWKIMDKAEMIDDAFDYAVDVIDNIKREEWVQNEISESTLNAINELSGLHESDLQKIKIKKEINYLFYNNKDKPLVVKKDMIHESKKVPEIV